MKLPAALAELIGAGNNAVIGVDIGTATLKLVELESTSKGLKLIAAQVVPIPAGGLKEGKIEDAPGLAQVLSKAVVASRTKTKNIAFAVPSSSVITRLVEMPGDLSEDEMEMQLLMEAEQYIPYSLEEVALDFTKMSTSEDGEQAQILLAASRRIY